MAKADKTGKCELSLGGDFDGAVFHINGLTISVHGSDNPENGSVTVDITNGSTPIFSAVAHTDGSVQLKPPAKGQDDDPNVIHSSPDKRALQVGDVLGRHFVDLPKGLERLDGWLIYNITEDGVPQALEPIESAPEGFVDWGEANDHVKITLKEQGHTNARLWTEKDSIAIFSNVVEGGHNDKAQLDLSGSFRYWGNGDIDRPDCSMLHFPDGGGSIRANKYSFLARARATQDVPELA